MTVRARLALQFVAVTAVILGVFCLALYAWVGKSLDSELEIELANEYRSFEQFFVDEVQEIRRGFGTDLRTEVLDYMGAHVILGEVRHSDGTLVYASEGFSSRIRGDHVRTKVRGIYYRGRVGKVTPFPGEEYTLIVGISEQSLRHALAQLRLFMFLFCPLVLGLAYFIGLGFVRRALRPVEAMRLRAEHISRESLTERLPVPASPGEFLNLACTFNGMLDRLSRAFSDLENFAGDAAHELRTPLATLRAEIETTIQQRRTPEEYEAALASMAEDVTRLTRVVTNLLTLSRLDMNQYDLQREPVALAPLLAECLETWEAAVSGRPVRVSVDRADPDAIVYADPVALRRVVNNLVENAVKYNREPGRVTLSAAREADRVVLRVADTGIGIPADHLPRLFQRFYRVDPARSRDTGGAGLGLAICRSLVAAHGGEIAVTSTPGEGSVFTVTLPATAAATGPCPSPAT